MRARQPSHGLRCACKNRGIVSRLPHSNSDGLSVPVKLGFLLCPAVPPAPACGLIVGGGGVRFQAVSTPRASPRGLWGTVTVAADSTSRKLHVLLATRPGDGLEGPRPGPRGTRDHPPRGGQGGQGWQAAGARRPLGRAVVGTRLCPPEQGTELTLRQPCVCQKQVCLFPGTHVPLSGRQSCPLQRGASQSSHVGGSQLSSRYFCGVARMSTHAPRSAKTPESDPLMT